MKHDAFALITGASRGLGMAFARERAARRQNLVLVAPSLEPLSALASELRHSNSELARAHEFLVANRNALAPGVHVGGYLPTSPRTC